MKRMILAAAALAVLTLSAPAQEPIKIGFISTFSGPSGNLGQELFDGFKLGLKSVGNKAGGHPVDVIQADLFPAGRAPLVVCNPPWLPARPSSPIEYAVYDPDSRMLRGFLAGLAEHLEPAGEGWLILSDLAEHLGLRPRTQLLEWITAAGLKVVDRHDVLPTHPRAQDASDTLHAARSKEVTSLWRLAAA